MTELTIQQTFDLALRHHQAGQLQEAEQLYRQVLARQAGHADAMHLLGMTAHQSGRNDVAVDWIRRAIAINPNFPEALSNLGIVLKHKGEIDEAISAVRQAIALRPEYAEAYNNLGIVLKEKGELDAAIGAYRRAIALKSNHPKAHFNLGNALNSNGQLDEAITAFGEAIALRPDYAEAYGNLGTVLKDKGQLDEAIIAFRRAIALNANFFEAYNNLGIALAEKGELDEAILSYRRVISIRPDYVEARNNLGVALKDRGQLDEAILAFRQLIAIRPNYAEAHNNLGSALKDHGQLDEAIAAYRQAIALKPNLPEAHNNLGNALKEAGQLDEAIFAFRQAIALKPNYAQAHGNLAFVLQYHPEHDARAIAEELRRWNRQHAQPLRKFIQPPSTSSGQVHANDRDPDRRLRIGYVSPDFRDHVVGRNILPLFQHHDRRQFEIICYAQVLTPDSMTGRFQQNADGWQNTVGVSDDLLAKQIHDDRIDILVDLALHSGHNRLLVFARKPAPVQVTFAGYPGSTGLDTIDYRLTDLHLDPPGLNDQFYSETSLRLPDSFWCYDPPVAELAVNALPAQSNGYVTFGCLNNFCKISEQVLQLWARVLKAVDRSRMLILCPEGSHRQPLLNFLRSEGIHLDRVELVAHRPHVQYLELYHRIDLGLDTFPYNGHTTSLDSFWMGVPVVTLVGQTVVGRAGLSQLTNLGLTELIAKTPEQYVQIAAGLAGDLPRLSELRRALRLRMQASPLMDAVKFARNIETAYRQMWRIWCKTASAKN